MRLGDEKDALAVVTKSLLDIRQTELLHGGTSVGPQTSPEDVQVHHIGSVDQRSPSRTRFELRNASPVDDAARLAVESFVASLVAELAFVARAVANSMTFDSATVASAGECALDTWIGAVGLVVSDLAAVVAFASEAAALGGIRAVAGKVTSLVADTTGLVTAIAATSGISAGAPRAASTSIVRSIAGGVPGGVSTTISRVPAHDCSRFANFS